MTLAQQRAELLLLVDQASNTPAGELPSGTSGTPTTATTTALNGWLDDAQRKVAQSCFAVRGSGTAPSVIGQPRYDFDSFTVAGTTGTLWAALSASFNGVGLTYVSPSYLRLYFPNWQTDASGTPVYWTRHGDDQEIEIYPKPSAVQTIAVEGLIVPVNYANDSASPLWLPAHRHRLLVYAAAGILAEKNINDPRLASHIPVWKQEFLAQAVPLWQGIEYVTRSVFYPVPPS